MAHRLRASWGVTSSATGVTGVITGIDLRSEGSFITETDLYGRICAVFMYDVISTFGVDVQVKAEESGPLVGSQILVAGNSGYVKDVQITERNNAYQVLHISVEKTSLTNSAQTVMP